MPELSHNPLINAYNMDCMDFMKDKPDNYYDLAIVDPPYGIGGNKNTTGKHKNIDWDSLPPTPLYFTELKRVSINQIIWGANFYKDLVGGRIVWNKLGKDIGRRNQAETISDCEIAYHSFGVRIKMFSYTQIGNVEGNDYQIDWDRQRIHPTQKPVALYRWLLKNYAKEGDKILDTHGGSFSSAIACHTEGYALDICELDTDYFNDAVNRFKLNTCQEELCLT